MMHYRKGENIEEEIKKEDIPFKEFLPAGQDFLWMRVKGGTKVNNVVSFAKNALDKGEHRSIVWTGVGGGVVKTVSCAEIIKRTHPLYQLTRMEYTVVEEHWIPQMEGLDAIVVKRQIPCLHIFMTLDEIDDGVNGVQKPNVTEDFLNRSQASSSNSRGRGNRSEFRRKQNRNQAQKGSGDQRSGEKPKPQPPMQQKQQETTENQSNNQQQTKNSTENSGAKRKRNNRNKTPKPRDNPSTSQTSAQRQKQPKTPERKTEQEPMDT